MLLTYFKTLRHSAVIPQRFSAVKIFSFDQASLIVVEKKKNVPEQTTAYRNIFFDEVFRYSNPAGLYVSGNFLKKSVVFCSVLILFIFAVTEQNKKLSILLILTNE